MNNLHNIEAIEIQIESWKDFVENFAKAMGDAKYNWIFRGQSNKNWRLQTTLERTAEKLDIPNSELPEREAGLIRRFRRQYHHFSDSPPTDCLIEVLSIMRHYGAPTRLLDWTYSIYPALYFALETGDTDSAVWALNVTKLVKGLREDPRTKNVMKIVDDNRNIFPFERFKKSFSCNPPIPFACPVNPYRLNERLTIQQGVFVCPGDVSLSFEENLEATIRNIEPSILYKYVIPGQASVRKDFLVHLYQMNMHAAVLYPGLDGFARSLATMMALPMGMFPPDEDMKKLLKKKRART